MTAATSSTRPSGARDAISDDLYPSARVSKIIEICRMILSASTPERRAMTSVSVMPSLSARNAMGVIRAERHLDQV